MPKSVFLCSPHVQASTLKSRCHIAASSYILLFLHTIHARCHCVAELAGCVVCHCSRLVLLRVCVYVCVHAQAIRYCWYRSFADVLWHFLTAERQQQPLICGWTHTHARVSTTHTNIQRRRAQRHCVSQRRKCRCEQESVGRDHFTPVSTETTVHQQWMVNLWHIHLEAAGEHKFTCAKLLHRENICITLDILIMCFWFIG